MAAGTPRRGARVDLLRLATLEDPAAAYAELLAADGLRPAGPGMWAACRHRDVAAVLADDRLSHRFPDEVRSAAVGAGPVCDLLQDIVSSSTGIHHTRRRAELAARLAATVDAGWWERTDRVLADVVTAAVGGARGGAGTGEGPRRLDGVADLATPVAAAVSALLAGALPGTGAAEAVTSGAPALGRAVTALRLGPDEQHAAASALADWRRAFADLATTPIGPGRPRGLVDALAAVPAESGLARAESGLADPATCNDVLFTCATAFEMLRAGIAAVLATLAAAPDRLADVRRDPVLAPAAVHEALRLECPASATARLATEASDVAGRSLAAGRTVVALLATANRDPDAFADPDAVDLTRAPAHLAFGAGRYRCPAEGVAVDVVARVLGRLLERTETLAAAAPVRRADPERASRALVQVPLLVTAGAELTTR